MSSAKPRTKLELREYIAARLIDLEPHTTLQDLVEIVWPLVEQGGWPDTFCPVCHAEPGEPCTITRDGPHAGEVRPERHFYRGDES